MKRYKGLLFFTLTILIILSSITGCSSTKSTMEDMDIGQDSRSSIPETDRAEIEEESSPLQPDKVITTINLSFETREFEKTRENLDGIIKKYKAYVENSNISYNQHYNNKSFRRGNFTIRVPQESLNDFKSELSGIGNLTYENTNKEDVSKQYRDTESRLKVINTKEERILALLEKAEKIEDIIALENQLGETIAEKEGLKANLLNIDDKVDFTTIFIEIQEVEKLSDNENIKTGFGTRIRNAIINSGHSFKTTLEDLTISLIYLLPFVLVLAFLVFIGRKIYMKLYNRKDKS